jgi:hypothetical protein
MFRAAGLGLMIIAVILFIDIPLIAQERSGTLRGTVLDVDTKSPLVGANVFIVGTTRGAATNEIGVFVIKDIPVASYTIKVSYIGYDPVKITDVIVRSDRVTTIPIELRLSYLESEMVEVTSGYFEALAEQPLSVVALSREEVRRAPGVAGDVSRIIQVLPSIAKVNDQYNGLIVRGGSPIENIFYIDNIEIPNLNHFPTQGSTGGAIGLLNVDFLEDVRFYTGGAPSLYQNRLSSVMDIRFREGNRERFDGKMFLDMAGFGGVIEGPLPSAKGSWLISARRSYLDLIVDLMDLVVSPVYGSFQGKIVYDLSRNHRLNFVVVSGYDKNTPTEEQARDLDYSVYGSEEHVQFTLGVDWRWLWARNGYSNTSLSYSTVRYKSNWSRIRTDNLFIENDSQEQWLGIRNSNRIRFDSRNTIEFGMDAKYLLNDYNTFFAESIDPLGNASPSLLYMDAVSAEEYGVFIHFVVQPYERLKTIIGLRGDHYTYSNRYSFSPRLFVSYSLTDRTSINGSIGSYTQLLPMPILVQNKENKNLKNPQSVQYIVGIEHLLTGDTRLSVEVYRKEYANMPLNPAQPTLFVLDETIYQAPFYLAHRSLIDDGKAEAQGVEATLQKKLVERVYGIVSAAYSSARYKAEDGIWRNRVFDNRIIVNIEGGFKPNEKWEFSVRWVYAGGTPYTPFDIERSTEVNSGVFDETRINADRHPDYNSLSLRFDRRFHFARSNLIFYLDIWNVYNRRNIASYFWNEFKNEKDIQYQWGIMPVFGLEYEW